MMQMFANARSRPDNGHPRLGAGRVFCVKTPRQASPTHFSAIATALHRVAHVASHSSFSCLEALILQVLRKTGFHYLSHPTVVEPHS